MGILIKSFIFCVFGLTVDEFFFLAKNMIEVSFGANGW